MVPAVLAGIAAKLTGLGVAAKAGIGLGIATVATAGVATVMPVVVPDAPAGTTTAVEVQVPNVPDSNADLGLSTAADASGAPVGARTGLDVAAQTPAAVTLPANVAGRPASVPPVNGAATTGIERARETPAAANLPAFVPGPPAGLPVAPPVNLPPAAASASASASAGAGATGVDVAAQTPGGQFVPPVVKGMSGR